MNFAKRGNFCSYLIDKTNVRVYNILMNSLSCGCSYCVVKCKGKVITDVIRGKT